MARAKRMADQKWMFDKIIQATGPDFYWPMTEETLSTVGMDGSGDIRSVRGAIRKFTDIIDEMCRIATKREAMALQAEREGHGITAGQNYFTAAAYYTMAQGPIHEDGDARNLDLSAEKNASYDNFIRHAAHPIVRIDIPFEDSALPGLLHLPPHASGKTPCVVFLGGMDNFKEMLVTQPSDKFLEHGMAVLAFDGPGQNEALISRRIHCTENNFVTAGKAVMDYLLTCDDIDRDRIGITGISMGSFWLTQIVAHDPRYKAAAGFYVCHENGMNTIFNIANPMFKDRYMWMSGFDDEDAFDTFAARLTLEGLGAKIHCPYMMVCGEDDDLSPIEHSFKLYDEIAAPKTMLLFKDEVHGVSDNMSVRAMIADWMMDRFDGKDLQSRIIYLACRTGQEVTGGLKRNGELRE